MDEGATIADRAARTPQLSIYLSIHHPTSGTGLCGLALAQCCRVRCCTLTDVVPATLDNLRDNVGKLPPTAAPCRVAALDWRAPRAFLDAEERAPDLVLGADLVYEPSLAAPLATTLDALLSRAAREARVGVRPRALVACVPARSMRPGSQHPSQPPTAPAALPLAPGCPLGQSRAPEELWCPAQDHRTRRVWPPKVCGALRRGTSSCASSRRMGSRMPTARRRRTQPWKRPIARSGARPTRWHACVCWRLDGLNTGCELR